MGWRTVVISNTCKLDLRSNYISIRDTNNVKRIHLDEIDFLILETTAISLTAALLIELSTKGINVLFCDSKHNPHSTLNSLYGSHNSSDKIRKQAKWKELNKKLVWREIIINKIKNQQSVLNYFNGEKNELETYINDIEVGDTTNREGHAAKVYFNSLFGNKFSRKDENVTNSCLNYGYAIILSMVNREILSYGCMTQLGIHHDNQFNQYNLGCDLMEPFRPYIDYIVLKNNWIEFNTETKRGILDMLNNKVVYSGQKNYISNAIKLYCKNTLGCLMAEDHSKMEYVDYEL